MAEYEDEANDCHQGEITASGTYSVQCSFLRINSHVMIEGRPCRIVEMSTSGNDQVHLVAIDIFTNETLVEMCPSTHKIDVPHVTTTDYLLESITDDGFVSLIDEDGNTRDDLRLPADSEMAQRIKNEFARDENNVLVTVLSALGEEGIVACKKATN